MKRVIHYPDPRREYPQWKATRRLPCPFCGAPAGAMCVTRAGLPVSMPHSQRPKQGEAAFPDESDT